MLGLETRDDKGVDGRADGLIPCPLAPALRGEGEGEGGFLLLFGPRIRAVWPIESPQLRPLSPQSWGEGRKRPLHRLQRPPVATGSDIGALDIESQAMEALVSLGYSHSQAKDTLKEVRGATDLSDRVRKALQLLAKK